jgi:hypothetical protein
MASRRDVARFGNALEQRDGRGVADITFDPDGQDVELLVVLVIGTAVVLTRDRE